MDTKAEGRTEYPWVARLREAGLDVRTGTGVLSRDPEDSFTPPPGFRPGRWADIRSMLGRMWKGGTHRLRRLVHSKPHATLP